MADASYTPLVYRKQGGDEMVVASGGFLTVESGGIVRGSGGHLALNSATTSTDVSGDTVRINSITNTGTADSLIGFQSKPAQGTSMANNVIGAEISPRLNSAVALTGSGSVIGLHVDAYLKGTAAGTVAGDVRGLNVELVTDDAGTRTVSGNVSAIRVRAAFSAGTLTGVMAPIRIEKAESQTGSQQWDCVLELPSTNAGIWNDAPGTEPTTADGYIKVLVNGNARYIQLYSGAPAD